MIPHKITLSESDGVATLLALSFDTGRVVVRWGDEVTSHVTAYRRIDCTRCDGTGVVALEECHACAGSRGNWRRETVPRGYRLDAIAGEAGDRLCQDIGGLWDSIAVQSAGVGLAPLEHWLCASGFPRLSRPRLRGVARWLLLHRRGTLAHGRDIADALAFEQALPVGSAGTEADDLLGALLRAGVVRLYEFAPNMREGAIFMPGDGKQARSLRTRLESSADASAVGARHWYYARGERWHDVPEFSL